MLLIAWLRDLAPVSQCVPSAAATALASVSNGLLAGRAARKMRSAHLRRSTNAATSASLPWLAAGNCSVAGHGTRGTSSPRTVHQSAAMRTVPKGFRVRALAPCACPAANPAQCRNGLACCRAHSCARLTLSASFNAAIALAASFNAAIAAWRHSAASSAPGGRAPQRCKGWVRGGWGGGGWGGVGLGGWVC